MNNIYLGLGSNVGNRIQAIDDAVRRLDGHRQIGVVTRSSLYHTEPFGGIVQSDFLNCVLKVQSALSPETLLLTVKAIESDMGRNGGVRWGPRIIDIDILFYGRTIIDTADLTIPHPMARKRRFVLVPMNEIAAGFVCPETGMTIEELQRRCADTCDVMKAETAAAGRQVIVT